MYDKIKIKVWDEHDEQIVHLNVKNIKEGLEKLDKLLEKKLR